MRVCRERSTGKVCAMKKLKKSEMVRRGQIDHVKAERNVLVEVHNPYIVKLLYSFQVRSHPSITAAVWQQLQSGLRRACFVHERASFPRAFSAGFHQSISIIALSYYSIRIGYSHSSEPSARYLRRNGCPSHMGVPVSHAVRLMPACVSFPAPYVQLAFLVICLQSRQVLMLLLDTI